MSLHTSFLRPPPSLYCIYFFKRITIDNYLFRKLKAIYSNHVRLSVCSVNLGSTMAPAP